MNVSLLETWRRRRPGGPDEPNRVTEGEREGGGVDVCSVADLARRGRIVVSLPGLDVDVLVLGTALGVYAVENQCPR